MSDSDPALGRVAAGTDANDAVLAAELRSLKSQLAELPRLITEMGSIRGDLREYTARQEERDRAARQRDSEFREQTERRFREAAKEAAAVEARVTKLESFQSKILGAIAVAGAVGGAVGILAQFLLRGGS